MMDTKNYTTISGRSDSDSEGVFTDDDEWSYPMPLRESTDHVARPSNSSVENESFILTYSQRFSKLPDDLSDKANTKCNRDRHYKNKKQAYEMGSKFKRNLSLDIKQSQKVSHVLQLSDTENTSPAFGPHDASSIVEGSYDIPRSHQLPYHNLEEMFKDQIWSKESMEPSKSFKSLNEIGACVKTDTVETWNKHCYTNAAPSKLEGDVFRYDFIEQTDLPPVNRKLKPKTSTSSKVTVELTDRTLNNPITEDEFTLIPPSVDRNLKPNIYKVDNTSLLRSNLNTSGITNQQTLFVGAKESTVLQEKSGSMNHSSVKLIHLPTHVADEPRLQYFDLDLANPPMVNRQSINISNLSKLESKRIDLLSQKSFKSGVVYNSVDFVKTEAFKRIREEREKESENVNSDVKLSK